MVANVVFFSSGLGALSSTFLDKTLLKDIGEILVEKYSLELLETC